MNIKYKKSLFLIPSLFILSMSTAMAAPLPVMGFFAVTNNFPNNISTIQYDCAHNNNDSASNTVNPGQTGRTQFGSGFMGRQDCELYITTGQDVEDIGDISFNVWTTAHETILAKVVADSLDDQYYVIVRPPNGVPLESVRLAIKPKY